MSVLYQVKEIQGIQGKFTGAKGGQSRGVVASKFIKKGTLILRGKYSLDSENSTLTYTV